MESEVGMYSRLIPVLPVGDVFAERRFYESLGFELHVDPDEQYPDTVFAALKYGPSILFGVSIVSEFDPGQSESRLWWQFETIDIDGVHDRARSASLSIEQAPTVEEWGRRTLKLRSPNGYLVTFEEAASPPPSSEPLQQT